MIFYIWIFKGRGMERMEQMTGRLFGHVIREPNDIRPLVMMRQRKMPTKRVCVRDRTE